MYAIDNCFPAELLPVVAAFLVEICVTMEPCGNPLFEGCCRQHIACELLDRELIEWQVVVECVDEPVTIGPCRTWAIHFIAV